MALEFVKGVTTARTTTGTTQVSPSGITDLKAVILWCTFETADGITNGDSIWCQGWATNDGGSIQQAFTTFWSDDAATTAANRREMDTSAVVKLYSAQNTVDCVVDVSAWTSTSFTLNYSDAASAAILIHYVALGGSAITAARAFDFNYSTSTPQDVTIATGWGQPDLVLLQAYIATTLGAGTGNSNLSMGFGKDDSEQFVGMYQDNSSANMVLTSNARSAVAVNTGGTFDGEADLDVRANWPTDGFRLVYPDTFASTWKGLGLALKGTFTATIGNSTAPTAAAPQSQNLALASGTPKGAIIVSHENVVSSTQQASGTRLGGWMLGATDGTNEGFAAIVNEDANTAAICGRVFSQTKTIGLHDAHSTNGATLMSEADGSISGSNVVLSWNDTDTAAIEYWYLVLGETVSAPTVDAQPGAFSFTGAAALLAWAHLFDSQPGTYTLTGVAASVVAGRAVNAEPGVFAVTGTDATLLAARAVSADAGSYAVTGAAATLAAGLVFNAEPGSFAVTGDAASLGAGYAALADPGVFAVSGADADLVYTPVGAYTVDAQPGAYAVTGTDAELLYGALKAIDAQPGTADVTGEAATLAAGYVFSADPGVFTVTGAAASVVAGRTVSADPATYAVTVDDIATPIGRALNAQPGAYTVTGADADLLLEVPGVFAVNAEPGTITVTGIAATATATRELNSQPASYAVNGIAATLFGEHNINAAAAAYTITGQPMSPLADRLLVASPGAYAFTGIAAGIGTIFDMEIDAGPGNVTVGGVSANLVFAPGLARLTTRGGRITWNTTGDFRGENHAGRITSNKEGAVA